MHCSAELKYGLEDSLVIAYYTNETCADGTLLFADLEPNGCNGYNYSAACEGEGESRQFTMRSYFSYLFAFVQC